MGFLLIPAKACKPVDSPEANGRSTCKASAPSGRLTKLVRFVP